MSEEIKELITRRRRQVTLHSCIYYRLNDSIISDSTFDQWCNELVELQANYPGIAKTCEMHDKFEGFDGSTGFHLSHDPGWVARAQQMLPKFKEMMRNGNSTP